MSAKSSGKKRSASAEGAGTDARSRAGDTEGVPAQSVPARSGPRRSEPRRAELEAGAESQSIEKKRDADVAIVCGVSDDGMGVDIIRRRGERIEAGTVRRLEQGKPIHGEVVRLRPREHFPMICDVEVEVPGPARPEASASLSGPAQVATETYRKNWDAVYGRSKKQDPLLN